jgi:hypothetical protein
MQPADRIKELFKNAKLAVDADTDEQVFRDVLRAYEEIKTDEPDEQVCARADTTPGFWRSTMKSPITKLAIAAVFVIGCLMGIMMWKGTGSSVALASVLTKIEEVAAYTYKMHLTMTGQMSGLPTPMNTQMEATVLTSQDLGMQVMMDTTDPNRGQTIRQEMYMLPQKKAMFMISPAQKQYLQLDLDETLVERTQKQNNDPRAMVKQILSCNYTNLGRSTIDGVQVEGFETTDPNYSGGIMGQVDVKIWVDVKTQLPVKSEMDMEVQQMHMHYVMDDFRWNVLVDPHEFDPVIPADYKSMAGGPMKMPAMDEKTAVEGLRLFAEMSGRYPDELNVLTISAKLGELGAKQMVEDAKSIGKEASAKKFQDQVMPIAMAAAFYGTLVRDKKDPAYYGKTVTPQDVDKVLLRWRVSDDEYRVIFGSLHAETVKADVLAELEKDLPK